MRKLFKLPLACVAILCRQSVLVQALTEILSLPETVFTFGDEIEGKIAKNDWLLRDREFDRASTITISEEFPDMQWILIDWSSLETEIHVQGVLIHTDETQMTSGHMKFYVDNQECTSGSVGPNAVGGAFNCYLRGSTFKVVCTETCSPSLAVSEIKLWDTKIISLGG